MSGKVQVMRDCQVLRSKQVLADPQDSMTAETIERTILTKEEKSYDTHAEKEGGGVSLDPFSS